MVAGCYSLRGHCARGRVSQPTHDRQGISGHAGSFPAPVPPPKRSESLFLPTFPRRSRTHQEIARASGRALCAVFADSSLESDRGDSRVIVEKKPRSNTADFPFLCCLHVDQLGQRRRFSFSILDPFVSP